MEQAESVDLLPVGYLSVLGVSCFFGCSVHDMCMICAQYVLDLINACGCRVHSSMHLDKHCRTD